MTFSEEFEVGNQHWKGVLDGLDTQRKERSLCDVVLCVEDEEFPAHRCLLAAVSPFFRSMFAESNFTESSSKSIRLHSMDKRALATILDMIYTGKLRLSLDNLYSVLATAEYLLLPEVLEICSKFMLSILESIHSTDEALRIQKSAHVYSLRSVQDVVQGVIANRFWDIVESSAFGELSFDDIVELLRNERIFEHREIAFWEAGKKWLNCDLENRAVHTTALMKHVRFPLIDPGPLMNTVQPSELMQSPECQALIMEAVKFQLLADKQSTMGLTPRHKPRCKPGETVIYCLTGWKHFKCYLPAHNKWYSLQAPMQFGTMKIPFTCSTKVSLLTVDQLVYASLHVSQPEEVSHYEMQSLMVYSIATNTWTRCSLPTQAANNLSITLISSTGSLYACSRNGIEKYQADEDSWVMFSDGKIRPSHLMVTDDNNLYFYNMEDGVVQMMKLDQKPEMIQSLMPGRFVAGVTNGNAVKLPNHELLVSLRTYNGRYRRIFHIKTNQWRELPMCSCAGKTPLRFMDPSEPTSFVCDRDNEFLYILDNKSGYYDIPPQLLDTKYPMPDAALPFFRFDLRKRTWARLASLPEFMALGANSLEFCIHDGFSDMAQACLM